MLENKDSLISVVVKFNVLLVMTRLRTRFLVLGQEDSLGLVGLWGPHFTMKYHLWTRSGATLWCSSVTPVQRKKLISVEKVRGIFAHLRVISMDFSSFVFQ